MNAEVKALQFIVQRSDHRSAFRLPRFSILLLMKTFRLFLILSLFFSISSTPATKAQDEQTASAAWQITKFDITVNAPTGERDGARSDCTRTFDGAQCRARHWLDSQPTHQSKS